MNYFFIKVSSAKKMSANIINYIDNETTIIPQELIAEELDNFSKISNIKIKVIIANVPTIKSDDHYPTLKFEDKDYRYIYLYYVVHLDDCRLNKDFHFGEKPKYFLTFSHMDQKKRMVDKINKLRKEIEDKTNFGLIKCTKQVIDNVCRNIPDKSYILPIE